MPDWRILSPLGRDDYGWAGALMGAKDTRMVAVDAGHPARVVIIDDEPDFRLLVKARLRIAGFTIVGEAADGHQGIDTVARLHPDIVVTELLTPVMNGIETTRTIRTRFPSIRIVAVTLSLDQRLRTEALAAGADAYLSKTALDDLVQTLESIVTDAAAAVPTLEATRRGTSDQRGRST
jgi:DNA-binding NarL/FixJ family response regulator